MVVNIGKTERHNPTLDSVTQSNAKTTELYGGRIKRNLTQDNELQAKTLHYDVPQ